MPLISLKSIESNGILYFSVIDFQEAYVFIYRFFIVDIATCSLVIFLCRISADEVCFKHNNLTNQDVLKHLIIHFLGINTDIILSIY